VTAHPTAEWTLQQLREAIPSDHPYQFLIHDRDSILLAGPGRGAQRLLWAEGPAHAGACAEIEGLCFILHLLRTVHDVLRV
jgi:hypothetical protein